MAQANVEIVKRGLDAFSRGDLDSFTGLATQDFVWFPALPGAIEGGGYRGREGIERYFADIGDTWEELRVLGEEVRDLSDRVLVLGRTMGRGKGSGVMVDAPLGFIVEFRGAKISSVHAYLDHGEALRAAGLPE